MSVLQDEDRKLIEEGVERFIDESYAFDEKEKRFKENGKFGGNWALFAELGWLMLPYTEESGGMGGGLQDVHILMRAFGRGLIREPFGEVVLTAGKVIELCLPSLLDDLISGDVKTVLAHGESQPDLGFSKMITRAEKTDDGYVLTGQKCVVLQAENADQFLVTALMADEPCIFQVNAATLGINRYDFETIDGRSASDISFSSMAVPEKSLIATGSSAQHAINTAILYSFAAGLGEIEGIAKALRELTTVYLNTREQFGVKLSQFQALQHQLANVAIFEEEISSLAWLVASNWDIDDLAGRERLVRGAKARACKAGRRLAEICVQLHGGMGVSDEMVIGHYLRRLIAMDAYFGDVQHQEIWLSQHGVGGEVPTQLSEEDQAFKEQVRAFISANLPDDIRYKVENNLQLKKEDHVRWQKILARKGWFAGGWPKQYGGAGWSETQQYIFDQENALGGAPFIIPYGVNMVGPVIQNFGTAEQQDMHLPAILKNEIWWAQGYSEPNSGSDLASLKCSARREGDEYIINGTKMWTTQAQYADMGHVLVRTDSSGRKQQGISFLLVDMKSPGITISPIVTIDGMYHTNQTFFDDVRVPVSNLVGEEGDGWKIARFLLQNERTAIADTGAKSRNIKTLTTQITALDAAGGAPPQILLYKIRLAEIECELMAIVGLEQKLVAAWESGQSLGYGPNALKVRATELQQKISVLFSDLSGPYKAAYDTAYVEAGKSLNQTPAQQASGAGYLYLYGRCSTIYGGTSEIQRNIIAKMIM